MLKVIDNTRDFKELFDNPDRNFYIYGAGFQGRHLLDHIRSNISLRSGTVDIKNILVTNKQGNPDNVGGGFRLYSMTE